MVASPRPSPSASMTTMSRSFLVDSLISPRTSDSSGGTRGGTRTYSPPTAAAATHLPPLIPLHPCPPGKHTDVLSLYSCRACVPFPPAAALKQAISPAAALSPSLSHSLASSLAAPPPVSLPHTPVLRPVPVSLPMPHVYAPLYTPTTPARPHLNSTHVPTPEKKSPVQGECVFCVVFLNDLLERLLIYLQAMPQNSSPIVNNI